MPSTKLTIRPIRLSDVDNIMTWVNNPNVVRNFQHFDKKFTHADEIKFIKSVLTSKTDFMFSLFEKRTGKYVGQGGIHRISWENKLGRLSLFIKPEFQGHGYGQEALKLLINNGFKNMKLHKLWLIVWATNRKSIHIYKKAGFKPEGLLRDEYFWRSRYHDMLRMSILAPEKRR